MSKEPIISVNNLGVCYNRQAYKPKNLREIAGGFKSLFSTKKRKHMKTPLEKHYWALKEIGFEAYEGDIIALVGRNGAGKSTLMKILANIMPPDTGSTVVNGTVSNLLALNTGQQPNLSGRENVRLYGYLLGMTKKELDQKMDSIIEFSQIGEFIDEPVKNYSSGMKSRLGFATMIKSEPDILLLDEVFAVGDAEFQQKATEAMKDFMKRAKIIFLVTHSLSHARKICNRGIWIERGQMKAIGNITDVIQQYEDFIKINREEEESIERLAAG